MDVYCPKANCGEPVDMDYFHDVAADLGSDYTTVMRDFQKRGCEALGEQHTERDTDAGFYAEALYDLLGDDMDGAAAMMEDYAHLFN